MTIRTAGSAKKKRKFQEKKRCQESFFGCPLGVRVVCNPSFWDVLFIHPSFPKSFRRLIELGSSCVLNIRGRALARLGIIKGVRYEWRFLKQHFVFCIVLLLSLAMGIVWRSLKRGSLKRGQEPFLVIFVFFGLPRGVTLDCRPSLLTARASHLGSP